MARCALRSEMLLSRGTDPRYCRVQIPVVRSVTAYIMAAAPFVLRYGVRSTVRQLPLGNSGSSDLDLGQRLFKMLGEAVV